MDTVTLVFSALFVAQTLIFLYVYRRAVTHHGVTQQKSQEITQERPRQETLREEGGGVEELHPSALAALRLIEERGNVMSSDVSKALNLSREHTARLLKSLHDRGYVKREGKPFRYMLTEKGLAAVKSKL
ncbi:MAG: winged helix DNA-binding protein [Candidatus Caldarchaeum sp.]|uniref:MarR family transcriptional regulator n=1 Tax=Caldiarchaeum subterraneum TaxID=311458 RepID=A0A7C4I387_CALS0|nr:winged helix DNA-binding protein [Candidatus Caldarchaeales archaeon]MDJ0272205.1 winged helix DNA-binding protein [Candidatus Caldarchaeales archaeon]